MSILKNIDKQWRRGYIENRHLSIATSHDARSAPRAVETKLQSDTPGTSLYLRNDDDVGTVNSKFGPSLNQLRRLLNSLLVSMFVHAPHTLYDNGEAGILGDGVRRVMTPYGKERAFTFALTLLSTGDITVAQFNLATQSYLADVVATMYNQGLNFDSAVDRLHNLRGSDYYCREARTSHPSKKDKPGDGSNDGNGRPQRGPDRGRKRNLYDSGPPPGGYGGGGGGHDSYRSPYVPVHERPCYTLRNNGFCGKDNCEFYPCNERRTGHYGSGKGSGKGYGPSPYGSFSGGKGNGKGGPPWGKGGKGYYSYH